MFTEENIAAMTAEELNDIQNEAYIDEYWTREADIIMAQYDYPEDF